MSISAEGSYCLVCGTPLDEKYSGCYSCERQRVQERAMIEAYAEKLGGMRAWEQYRFERFQENPVNAKALAAAKVFDYRTDNLVITGPTGTGKSHLAIAAARKTAQLVEVLKTAQLSREVRSCRRADAEEAVILRYMRAGVLVIDDLGASKDTEFLVGLIYEIVDGRYMTKPGGLIVTSNLTLDEMAQKMGDDRVPSRLAQMAQFFSLVGEQDHRVRRS